MNSSLQVSVRHSISVVTPVYNGEASIAELCRRLSEVLPRIATEYEIILVNDGSRDRSWEIISELSSRFATVRGLNLMRNYGQHNALLCGIRAAKYEVIVTMDDDLQHPPEEIPRLLEQLEQGFDVVYGAPKEERHGFMRALASRITRLALGSAIGMDLAKNVSAFRVFRTQLREAFAGYQTPFVSIDVLLTWATTRFTAIPVVFQPRYSGSSNYTFTKLVRHALDMMTGFSTAPLQLASLIGFGCTLFGSCSFPLRLHPLLPGRQRAGISISGLDYCDLFRRTAFRPRRHWRISRPHAFSDDESTRLRYSGHC